MGKLFVHFLAGFLILNASLLFSEPGFNGTSPGCSGSGCHTFQDNLVSVTLLSNRQVQISLSGTSSNVAGELVNSSGTVVAVNNSTSSNPFILTAPSDGVYLINAGFKNPNRRWDSTYVTIVTLVPPAAPTNLTTQLIQNPTAVELNWTDNSTNEEGFIVERETVNPNVFAVIDTVGPDVITYNDTSVVFATYSYRVKAFNAAGESGYSNNAQITVPVELVSFNATVSDNVVKLNWITSSETNNMGFNVQSKKDVDWETIAFIEGNGTTTQSSSYNYSDEIHSDFSGTLSYRLKQIDFNGTYSYSEIVNVEILYIPEVFSVSQNYPNPFNPSTKISYSLPEQSHTTIKIYNSLGSEVKTLVNETQNKGKHEISFNAENLAGGIYYYQVKTDNFVETRKMVLLK